MSVDAPLLSGYRMTPIFNFYPGLIRSCISLMIAVGDKGAETLLTECNKIRELFRSPGRLTLRSNDHIY